MAILPWDCPHCGRTIHLAVEEAHLGSDPRFVFWVHWGWCPGCDQMIVLLRTNVDGQPSTEARYRLVYPKSVPRYCPPEVPPDFADDFREASLVFLESPKASAALSRRLLQHTLREKAGVKHGDLNSEIDQVMPSLPSHLAESIDAVRVVGNFAAHPIKSQESGSVTDVEPGEAEWNLDVLDSLFDFYFVQPERTKSRRTALDQKLKEAGKPPLK